MDEKTIQAEIETFFTKENIGESDRKKLTTRLPKSIQFFLSIGVGLDDIPTPNQIEKLKAFLTGLTQEKGRYKGKPYEMETIKDWIRKTERFYNVRNGNVPDNTPITEHQITIPDIKEDLTQDNVPSDNITPKGEALMTTQNSETILAENSVKTAKTVQHSQLETVQEKPDISIVQPEPSSPVEEVRKPGRPKSTSRSEKFTLYMTPKLMKDISMLADFDEVTTTDIMNEALEYYCVNSRTDDLNFLYTLERKKQERRRLKAGS